MEASQGRFELSFLPLRDVVTGLSTILPYFPSSTSDKPQYMLDIDEVPVKAIHTSIVKYLAR